MGSVALILLMFFPGCPIPRPERPPGQNQWRQPAMPINKSEIRYLVNSDQFRQVKILFNAKYEL